MKLLNKTLSIVIMTGVMLSLTGCGPGWEQFKPLPDEERYQFINPVKEGLDFETAGEVLEGRYDSDDGVFSPSFYYAQVQGEDTFSVLSERLLNFPGADCPPLPPKDLTCSVGQVRVKITTLKPHPDNVISIEISDSYSGRITD